LSGNDKSMKTNPVFMRFASKFV